MLILAAADIHGAVRVYEWLAAVVRQRHPELVIVAGDLLAGGWEAEQREQAAQVVSLLRQFPQTVLYLMGNDDLVSLDYEDERIRPLHGRRLEFGGFGFVGYQYTPPFMGTIFEKPESGIAEDAAAVLEPLLDSRTVFVSHGPIFGVLDVVPGAGHVGSRSLAALLKRRPVLAHIHGHIHECVGRERNHFNVASAARRRAFLINLPSLDHEVLHA